MGWITAFLLIALAPLTPHVENTGPDRRGYALALELLPYLPILGAVVLFAAPHVPELSTFLLLLGFALLVLVLVRQMLIIFENITLTSGLEREVAARTAELEGLGAIVNSSADAIVGKTPEGVITSWNPGAERQYGYTAAEVIGRDIAFLIPPDRRETEAGVLASIRAGGEARSYETERLRKDGASVPISLTISPHPRRQKCSRDREYRPGHHRTPGRGDGAAGRTGDCPGVQPVEIRVPCDDES